MQRPGCRNGRGWDLERCYMVGLLTTGLAVSEHRSDPADNTEIVIRDVAA